MGGVSKDRAAPFSRKHIRYWLPVTGGMILIGALCLAVGFCTYEAPSGTPEKIVPVLPPATIYKKTSAEALDASVPDAAAGAAETGSAPAAGSATAR